MVKVALFVRLEAKPEKVEAVAEFLRGGLPLVEAEPDTKLPGSASNLALPRSASSTLSRVKKAGRRTCLAK